MRELKDDNKPNIEDYLPEAWELLSLKGNRSWASFEALLIEAVMNITIHKKGVLADKYREVAQKCDAYLLALGLLDGYYHTKEDGTPYIATDRHKDYLSNSDYMELVCSTFKSTDNININDAQSKPRRNISQDDTRCRKYLCKYLSKTNNCQKCLEDGIKAHTKIIELPDGHKKRKIILPEPCFSLSSPLINTEQEESKSLLAVANENKKAVEPRYEQEPEPAIIESADSETLNTANKRTSANENIGTPNEEILPKLRYTNNPPTTIPEGDSPDFPPPEPPQKDIKDFLLKVFGIISCGTSITICLTFIILLVYFCKVKIETSIAINNREVFPDSIKIAKDQQNLELRLGESVYLEIEVEPSSIKPENLDYVSSNNDIVQPKNRHSPCIIAAKELENDTEHEATITVHGDNLDLIEAKAIITVTDPNDGGIGEGVDDANNDG